MEIQEMKAIKNRGRRKKQRIAVPMVNQETIENEGTMVEQETIENQGTMVKQEMIENQGAMENEGAPENQGAIENQGVLENHGLEESIKMSSTAINTISAGVQEPNIYDSRGSVAFNREMVIGSRREFFFLTIPGVVRVLQIFLSGLHLGCFGYFSTYYSSLKSEVTIVPFYLSAIREVFFMLVNFHTFVTTFSIIVASVITVRSHTSLLGSLFLCVFDFVQFFMITASSVSLLMLYSDEGSKKVYGQSTHTRQGLSITGMLLGCLHLIGAIYDMAIYVRRLDARIIEP